ncbi:MAG: sigma-70 family RNA polymerase sigma factor [Myxococcota bacterium]
MSDPSPLARHDRLARQLYAAHSEQLLAFFGAAHRAGPLEAVDLLQQTFVELMSTLKRRPDLELRHPRAFLFKIAVRQRMAELAQARRQPGIEPEVSPEGLPAVAEADDLEWIAIRHGEHRQLFRALRHLSAEDRSSAERDPMLLYLRFWAGLTLAEVAEVLEMTPAAVAGRLRRACRRLRRHLRELERAGGGPSTSTTVLRRWQDAIARTSLHSLASKGRNEVPSGER